MELKTADDAGKAISIMQVRGAPLIGVTAAFGIYLASCEDSSDENLHAAKKTLIQTRPTAINLKWAVEQMNNAINASNHLGISPMASFSGALLFHTFYPWPQRPTGLVEEGFKELAKRWKPILDHADSKGVDICYEIHPGEDLHDGVTFERFLKATNNHSRAKILYDPSHF